MSIRMRLFLTDLREALVSDPNSNELALCQSDEAPHAMGLLLDYLDQHCQLAVNGTTLRLRVKGKRLTGSGDDTALEIHFEQSIEAPLTRLEVRNTVFTDLFFDQNNIVNIHAYGRSANLMLNVETPSEDLSFPSDQAGLRQSSPNACTPMRE